MENEYINCPKCGIRNFADDKVCGICKTKLVTPSNLKTKTIPATQQVNFKTIFLIIGGILFFYYAFIKEDQKKKTPLNETNKESHLENSPATQLVIINDQSKTPQQPTTTLFNKLLSSLIDKYSNRTKQEIANALVATKAVRHRWYEALTCV
jgi:hypothetical protein